MKDSSRRRVRLARRLSWLVVASMTLTALVPVSVSANHDPSIAPNANSHQFVDGNPTCDHFADLKIDTTPSDGTYGGIIEITGATSTSFNWALVGDGLELYDMAAVIVKAGSGAEVYFYNDEGDDSDTNLQSPLNDGDQQAEISHVEFCFNEKGAIPDPTPTPTPDPTPTPTPDPTPTPTPDPTPTPTPNPTPTPTPPPNPTPTPTPPPNPTPTPTPVPTPTPTPTPEPTPTPTPTGEVAAETGAPAVTLPPTDALSDSRQAPAGDNWRLILLAMAGILAATLLLTPTQAKRHNR